MDTEKNAAAAGMASGMSQRGYRAEIRHGRFPMSRFPLRLRVMINAGEGFVVFRVKQR